MSQAAPNAIIVSEESYASDDPYALVHSNVEVVNWQFQHHFSLQDIPTDSLRSYYIDYFLAQINNGGFSQFVFNSRWGDCIDYVTGGFAAIGAEGHLLHFESVARQMNDRPGIDGLKAFFASDYFGDNKERDILNEFSDEFFFLEDSEDLTSLNAAWLRRHPDLTVLSNDDIQMELDGRAAAIPDLKGRFDAALAGEPRYMKLIRALCAASGHVLDRVTAGDPSHEYNGERLLAWHFLTDRGHHHMVDADGKAIMFAGHTDEILCEVSAGPEFGSE